MKEVIEAVVVLIIIANVLVSYQGFRDRSFYEKYLFEVDAILNQRQYYRLITSSFLHLNWWHLLFNMMVLYGFSKGMGYLLEVKEILVLYFGSMLAGDLLALYFHRHHPDYSSVGASGAVSGIIFASIVLFPGAQVSFLFIDTGIPVWGYGIVYLLLCLYGIRSQGGNVSHEAHVGGAIAGVLIALLIEPAILARNWWIVTALLVPFTLFMIVAVRRPEWLLLHSSYGDVPPVIRLNKDMDDEEVLNHLLEKINDYGFESLSKSEKKKLEELSRKIEI